MAFCGQCGAPLDGGKFCSNCGTPVEVEENHVAVVKTAKVTEKTSLWKKLALGAVLIVVACFIMTRCTSTSKVPCKSCGNTPTKAYTNDYSGEKEYYCSTCSSDCAFCSNKATKHYTSGLGTIIFTCDDCYKEIQNWN